MNSKRKKTEKVARIKNIIYLCEIKQKNKSYEEVFIPYACLSGHHVFICELFI
jgi:hypothetical protein